MVLEISINYQPVCGEANFDNLSIELIGLNDNKQGVGGNEFDKIIYFSQHPNGTF